MRPRRTPKLDWLELRSWLPRSLSSRALKRFRVKIGYPWYIPRWNEKRYKRRDRKALAAFRRHLRKLGLPTSGGDCHRTEWAMSARQVAIAEGRKLLCLGRTHVCGVCGATGYEIENPCPGMKTTGAKCQNVPF